MWTLPQFGIFAQGTNAHYFMEFDLRLGVTPADAVLGFGGLRTPEVSAGGVNLVVAFAAEAWRQVAPQDAPASLADFREITVPDGRHAPATQHDAWLRLSGGAPDVTWDHARAASRVLNDVATLVTEQPGFVYPNSDIFVIGDTPLDIDAAHAEGCTAIAVATGHYAAAALRDAGADDVLETLEEELPIG